MDGPCLRDRDAVAPATTSDRGGCHFEPPRQTLGPGAISRSSQAVHCRPARRRMPPPRVVVRPEHRPAHTSQSGPVYQVISSRGN